VKSQQIIVCPALVPASRVPRDDESRPAPSGEATLESHPIGRVFYAPFDVVFSRFDVVEPDLLYLSNERAGSVLTPDNVRGTPELVIEIGSPSTRARDETTKRRLYEWAGVSEYWVVDPELDLIRASIGKGATTSPALWSGRRRLATCSQRLSSPGWRFRWRASLQPD
jgi:hypothetical protein